MAPNSSDLNQPTKVQSMLLTAAASMAVRSLARAALRPGYQLLALPTGQAAPMGTNRVITTPPAHSPSQTLSEGLRTFSDLITPITNGSHADEASSSEHISSRSSSTSSSAAALSDAGVPAAHSGSSSGDAAYTEMSESRSSSSSLGKAVESSTTMTPSKHSNSASSTLGQAAPSSSTDKPIQQGSGSGSSSTAGGSSSSSSSWQDVSDGAGGWLGGAASLLQRQPQQVLVTPLDQQLGHAYLMLRRHLMSVQHYKVSHRMLLPQGQNPCEPSGVRSRLFEASSQLRIPCIVQSIRDLGAAMFHSHRALTCVLPVAW